MLSQNIIRLLTERPSPQRVLERFKNSWASLSSPSAGIKPVARLTILLALHWSTGKVKISVFEV